MELLIERPEIMPEHQAFPQMPHAISTLKFAHGCLGKNTSYLVKTVEVSTELLKVSLICVIRFQWGIKLSYATGVDFTTGHKLQFIIEPETVLFTIPTKNRVANVRECERLSVDKIPNPLDGISDKDLLVVKFMDTARGVKPSEVYTDIAHVNIALWQTIDNIVLPTVDSP